MSLVLVSSIAVRISRRITTYRSQWLIQFYHRVLLNMVKEAVKRNRISAVLE